MIVPTEAGMFCKWQEGLCFLEEWPDTAVALHIDPSQGNLQSLRHNIPKLYHFRYSASSAFIHPFIARKRLHYMTRCRWSLSTDAPSILSSVTLSHLHIHSPLPFARSAVHTSIPKAISCEQKDGHGASTSSISQSTSKKDLVSE